MPNGHSGASTAGRRVRHGTSPRCSTSLTATSPSATAGSMGDSMANPRTDIDGVLARVVVDLGPDCWLWTGAQSQTGYGFVKVNQKMTRVHRYVYEQLVGPIGDDLTIDHLCRNRACCNPEHLEPVSI